MSFDWDDLLFVNPRATFDNDADEEPWYWGVLDEDPMTNYLEESLDSEDDKKKQEQAAGDLFANDREGTPPWAPGDINMPRDYVPRAIDRSWRDSTVGPILRLEPTHHPCVMGEDDSSDGAGPNARLTPITGHTPPGSPLEDSAQYTTRAVDTMTLSQAHR